MQQPMGYMVLAKEDYVCLLKKSFYGLKQSPRKWYMRVDSFMIPHNFRRCTYDSLSTLEDVMMSNSYIYYCMWMTCSLLPRIKKRFKGSNPNLVERLR